MKKKKIIKPDLYQETKIEITNKTFSGGTKLVV
jgi:hypothetical protein